MELEKFGFEKDFNELYCRRCGGRIPKVGYCWLLGTYVKYGWCRWYTHGVSVCKALKEQPKSSKLYLPYKSEELSVHQTRLFDTTNTEKQQV